MSSQTPNLNLVLPVGTENVSRQIINENNQKIDTGFGTVSGQIGTINSNIGTVPPGQTVEGQISSLSDQIGTLTGNTSWPQWKELTLVNCEAWGAQHHFTKIGKVTYVGIAVKGLTANTNTTICTIPTGNRPLFNIEFDGFGGAAYLNHAHFKITAEGAVSVYSADTYATGFICYPSTT